MSLETAFCVVFSRPADPYGRWLMDNLQRPMKFHRSWSLNLHEHH